MAILFALGAVIALVLALGLFGSPKAPPKHRRKK